MCARLLKCRINTWTCAGCVHTPSLCSGRPSRRVGIPSGRALSVRVHCLQVSRSRQTVSIRRFPWVSVRKCRDTVGSVHECTRTVGGVRTPRAVCVRHLHTACGMRTPPTERVHLSTLIHDSDAHRQFLRYAYAIFRPSGCVGPPRELKYSVGDGLMRIADFCYFAQTAGSVSIRVSVWL